MKILVLGGTRFLGKRVVSQLIKLGYNLTVISRRTKNFGGSTRHIKNERSDGLAQLKGEYFDLILDFMCYSADDLSPIKQNIQAAKYILVSTTWVPKLWSGNQVIEPISRPFMQSNTLSRVTTNYLKGKLNAEQSLLHSRANFDNAVSLRLPIILGNGDHTGRIDFYLKRLLDGKPLILVDGGKNLVQIAAVEILAHAIAIWSTTSNLSKYFIWEGLPHDKRNVEEIVQTMATSLGLNFKFKSVPINKLKKKLPRYLEHEPLWQEFALDTTEANIFNAVNIKPEPFGTLSKELLSRDYSPDLYRDSEIEFLQNISNDR